MIDAKQARRIAEQWVSLKKFPKGYDDETVLVDERTQEESFGWIFFYESRRYLEGGKFTDRLAGNAPIIVKRESGELLVTGTAHSLEHYVSQMKSEGVL